jgi:hypothetical protein
MAADEDMGICDWTKRGGVKQSGTTKTDSKIRCVIALKEEASSFPN